MFSILNENFGLNERIIVIIGIVISMCSTFLMLKYPFGFLPKDQGREYAVNGALSKGKTRGVGLIMVLVLIAATLLFVPFSLECLIYMALTFLMMLSGYLDDAAKNPWSDYKKGAIDLVLSIAMVVTFLYYNDSTIQLFNFELKLPLVLYGILGIILIWVSINVTNCSDGVDGLCGSVSAIVCLTFALIFTNELSSYTYIALIFAGILIAYLKFNWSPSRVLMGDAGSRAIGFLLALFAMKSGRPFMFVPLCLVFIIDGGLGLVKVFIMRFLKVPFLTNIRFPLHDHLRKNKGFSDIKAVVFFIICQLVMSLLSFILVKYVFN